MNAVGKISDALDKFAKERKTSDLQPEAIHIVAERPVKRPERSVAKAVEPVDYDNKFNENLVTILQPHSFESEQFRMLKSHLLFPVSGTPPRSLMVTSALPGEGKSFVSANLAISIAQNINEYVLLVDCDLRRPTIQRNFGIGDTPGLSDYLSENISLSSVLISACPKKA